MIGFETCRALIHLVDDDGMVLRLPDALDAACRHEGIRAVFLQPSVIGPTAALMGEGRRAAIAAVARRHDIAIIENDVLGPLIEDRPPPVAAFAPERTLYVTSFTKTVLPGLRTGYLAVPDRMLSAVMNRHLVTNWIATPLIAALAHTALTVVPLKGVSHVLRDDPTDNVANYANKAPLSPQLTSALDGFVGK